MKEVAALSTNTRNSLLVMLLLLALGGGCIGGLVIHFYPQIQEWDRQANEWFESKPWEFDFPIPAAAETDTPIPPSTAQPTTTVAEPTAYPAPATSEQPLPATQVEPTQQPNTTDPPTPEPAVTALPVNPPTAAEPTNVPVLASTATPVPTATLTPTETPFPTEMICNRGDTIPIHKKDLPPRAAYLNTMGYRQVGGGSITAGGELHTQIGPITESKGDYLVTVKERGGDNRIFAQFTCHVP
jgi:hypothetical protein